jgi:hypothetical protein
MRLESSGPTISYIMRRGQRAELCNKKKKKKKKKRKNRDTQRERTKQRNTKIKTADNE